MPNDYSNLPNDFRTGFQTGQNHFQMTGFAADPGQIFGQLQGQQFGAGEAQKARQFQGAQATQGQQFQGQQADLARQFQGGQAEAQRALELHQAQIAADASRYPFDLKQQRFDQLFPMFQHSLTALGTPGQPFTAGGASGASPEITVGGTLNPQQVQQQVNSQRAANDQATEGRMRQTAGQTAGRGFGANSPLLMALQGQAMGQNLATNTANERETRLGAAQQNSQHVLSTQQAREAQFASRQGEDIARRQPYFQQSNALLAALAGLA